jgi:hypothetical protein
MRKMDLREAKACLDEYRVWLDTTCGMLKQRTGEGERRDAVGKRNTSLIAALLEVYRDEARILSKIILREMIVQDQEHLSNFHNEWMEIIDALKELEVAIDKAEQAREEYLNPDEAKEKGKGDPNSPRIIIRKD